MICDYDIGSKVLKQQTYGPFLVFSSSFLLLVPKRDLHYLLLRKGKFGVMSSSKSRPFFLGMMVQGQSFDKILSHSVVVILALVRTLTLSLSSLKGLIRRSPSCILLLFRFFCVVLYTSSSSWLISIYKRWHQVHIFITKSNYGHLSWLSFGSPARHPVFRWSDTIDTPLLWCQQRNISGGQQQTRRAKVKLERKN